MALHGGESLTRCPPRFPPLDSCSALLAPSIPPITSLTLALIRLRHLLALESLSVSLPKGSSFSAKRYRVIELINWRGETLSSRWILLVLELADSRNVNTIKYVSSLVKKESLSLSLFLCGKIAFERKKISWIATPLTIRFFTTCPPFPSKEFDPGICVVHHILRHVARRCDTNFRRDSLEKDQIRWYIQK